MIIIVGHVCTIWYQTTATRNGARIDGFQQVIVASNDQTQYSIIKTYYIYYYCS